MHPTTQLLEEARAKVSFPLKEMTQVVYGTQRVYDLFSKTQEIFDKYPEMINDADYFNKNRREQFLESPRKFQILRTTIHVDEVDDWMGALSHHNATVPSGVFYAMVLPAIRILGTDEQIKRWEDDCVNARILAAYAQTEMGHGSDVQNLETTATFDKNTDEFVIHTPSVSATKFWPGELGVYANWALVYAGLIVDGQKKGVYPFMVPIRDMETHRPLPGITVGDIGPKLGYHKKDNGYLAFNQVRVPRANMLQKFQRIDRDGSVHKQGNEKVSYSAMMIVRKLLIFVYGRMPATGLTIAIRYSIARQQFKNDKGVENSVLEYQSQQDKLLPLLAKQYAVVFGGFYARNLVDENFERVKKKDFSIMQLTHAILSGCKANYTYFAVECFEWCRLSCGGHGFAHTSGLPGQTFELTPNITLEGENKVMYLQLTRFLLKILQWAQTNPERIPQAFSFLRNINETLENKVQDSNLNQLSVLSRFLQQNVASVLMSTVTKIQKFTSQGISFKEVWDFKVNDDLVEVASAFMEYFNFNIFEQKIAEVQNPSVKQALTTLCSLFGVHTILHQSPYLIEGDLITSEQIKQLRVHKEQLLTQVKENAIGYVDAFEFSDNHLKTLIGCHDGRPYERLLEWAQNTNSMNKNSVAKGIMHLRTVKPKL